MFKLQLFYIEMTDLLQFTIHFENPTVNLSALCNSCAKTVLCLSELTAKFLDEGNSIQNTNEHFFSHVNISFVYFALHPSPQRKIYRSYMWSFKQIHRALSRQPSEFDTYSYELLASQCPRLFPSKILTFSPGSPSMFNKSLVFTTCRVFGSEWKLAVSSRGHAKSGDPTD